MDYALFQLINGLAGRWPALDELMRFFATDYIVPTSLICLIVFLWFSGRHELQEQALLGIVSLAVANVFVLISNIIWFRPRPFTDHDVNLLFYHPSDPSFPANSAATTWALACALWMYDRGIGGIALVLAFMMGLSRIFVGVHYPLDILAGAIIGIVAARIVVRRLASHLSPLFQILIGLASRLRLA